MLSGPEQGQPVAGSPRHHVSSPFSRNVIRTLTQRLQEERRSGVQEVEELRKGSLWLTLNC